MVFCLFELLTLTTGIRALRNIFKEQSPQSHNLPLPVELADERDEAERAALEPDDCRCHIRSN